MKNTLFLKKKKKTPSIFLRFAVFTRFYKLDSAFGTSQLTTGIEFPAEKVNGTKQQE